MKELKKLALILRSLGISAKVVGDNPIYLDDNIYLECSHENVHFDVWFYDGAYELHYTLGTELIYDTVYLNSPLLVIHEITEKYIFKEA